MQLFETSLCFILVYIHFYNVQCAETRHPQPGLKYLLMWTSRDIHPFSHWETGQKKFIESRCEFSNCFVTEDRELLGDVTKFDAIAFNGRNIRASKFLPEYNDFPKTRSPSQKYIFVDMEPADLQSVCDPRFDGFFNMTATYKLNSDILFTYFTIKNKMNETVGPSPYMTWENPMLEIDEDLKKILSKKNKAVAWFVPPCDHQRFRRQRIEDYAKDLQEKLKNYNLTLDIYYSAKNNSMPCMPFICPRQRNTECEEMLKHDYFFYLAYEHSLDGFVGREVMKSMLNFNVPIVSGAADYRSYLPPGSYEYIHIDAKRGRLSPDKLASKIADVIEHPSKYYEYFRWRRHYSYSWTDKMCRLCAALNNDAMMGTQKVYPDFRAWWDPKYEKRCNKISEERDSFSSI